MRFITYTYSVKALKRTGFSLVLLFLSFLATPEMANAQSTPSQMNGVEPPQEWTPNLTSFDKLQTYPLKVADQYNSEQAQQNPDYGILPPGEDSGYFEVIDKRTATERFFRKTDNPSVFYIKKSINPINYIKGGIWRAINPRLKPVGNGAYEAKQQPAPTLLNILQQRSGLQGANNTLYFNDVKLQVTYKNNTQTTFNANWSNYTIGSNGIYIKNVFPYIDMKIVYGEGRVESTYIIKKKLSHIATAQIIDQLDFGNSTLTIDTLSGNMNNNKYYGSLYIGGSANNPLFIYKANKVWDNSHIRSHGFKLPYIYNNSSHQITMLIDSNIIGNDTLTFPIFIDPTVVYGPFAGAGDIGSATAPSFCSQNLTISFPGGSTPYDFSPTWQIETGYTCNFWGFSGLLSDGGVWFTSSCGGESPSGAGACTTCYSWQCTGGCNGPGTWTPTLPFGADPSTKTMVSCYTPSCSAQNMTFTINLTNFTNTNCGCSYFNTYYGFPYGSDWILDSWSVKVQGRTLETPTASGTGTQTYNLSSCNGSSVLDPQAQFGVPGYTYSWSNGANTPTITVPNYPNGQAYTCTVTDACGNTSLATFNLDCPLATGLVDFTAQKAGSEVALNWKVLSSTDYKSYEVQRSTDAAPKDFSTFATVASNQQLAQNYSYRAFDKEPVNGTDYYRLKMTDHSGNDSYSKIISVNFFNGDLFQIVPNPSNGSFTVRFATNEIGQYNLQIVNTQGKILENKFIQSERGLNTLTFNKKLPEGIYLVKLSGKDVQLSKRLIINK